MLLSVILNLNRVTVGSKRWEAEGACFARHCNAFKASSFLRRNGFTYTVLYPWFVLQGISSASLAQPHLCISVVEIWNSKSWAPPLIFYELKRLLWSWVLYCCFWIRACVARFIGRWLCVFGVGEDGGEVRPLKNYFHQGKQLFCSSSKDNSARREPPCACLSLLDFLATV